MHCIVAVNFWLRGPGRDGGGCAEELEYLTFLRDDNLVTTLVCRTRHVAKGPSFQTRFVS